MWLENGGLSVLRWQSNYNRSCMVKIRLVTEQVPDTTLLVGDRIYLVTISEHM